MKKKNRILLLKKKKKKDDLCTLGHSANWVRLERRLMMAHLNYATPFMISSGKTLNNFKH